MLSSTAEKRFKRGYTPNLPSQIKKVLEEYGKTCLPCSIAWALLYLVSIIAAGAAVVILGFSKGWTAALIAYLPVVIFIARQQRGLELMVHDASHASWHRSKRAVNDTVANLLVAFPVLSTVKRYWESHRVHHGRYGSAIDPCRRRFENMGLGTVDLSSNWKIAKAVLRWLPAYNAEYYAEIGSVSVRTWIAFLAWHLAVLVVPAAAIMAFALGTSAPASIGLAAGLWGAFWIIPASVVLPVLRSIAEAEEHDYSIGDTEFETTFTNASLIHRVIFHPWNDAYHLVHHMYPSLPTRIHHKAHWLLMKHDPDYRQSLHRRVLLQMP